MCVAFSVDNASVNMGRRNSINANNGRVLVKNLDCTCHMAHNASHKGWGSFLELLPVLASEVNVWIHASKPVKYVVSQNTQNSFNSLLHCVPLSNQ
jgi:hypothetical protein